ncbi:hypothetical protein RHS04_00682 [Rhizoctonia solani]|uniref:DUF6534 domain-containing protein n=1 Tax=Rhizoctonia solani TaxID=456999 RepID=A0A8H7LL63_9AGAM
MAVQSFYGFRAWKVMKSNRLFAALMIILGLAACAGGIGSKVIFAHYDNIVYAMKITFESQLPPTLVAVALFCVYTTKNDSFFNIPLILMQCKIYGISLLHTLNVRESLAESNRGADVTPEGCAITSGALQQFDLESLTFAKPGLTTVIDRLPVHHRDTKLFPQAEPGHEQGAKRWQPDTDDEGSRSILTDDRMDDHEVQSKSVLTQ